MDWLSVTFVVLKKEPGTWRGVVDMRGPNSQTRRVNFPYPELRTCSSNRVNAKFVRFWTVK